MMLMLFFQNSVDNFSAHKTCVILVWVQFPHKVVLIKVHLGICAKGLLGQTCVRVSLR